MYHFFKNYFFNFPKYLLKFIFCPSSRVCVCTSSPAGVHMYLGMSVLGHTWRSEMTFRNWLSFHHRLKLRSPGLAVSDVTCRHLSGTHFPYSPSPQIFVEKFSSPLGVGKEMQIQMLQRLRVFILITSSTQSERVPSWRLHKYLALCLS